jgi:hypothetical protein
MPHNNFISQREPMGKSSTVQLLVLFLTALTAPVWAGFLAAAFVMLLKYPIAFVLGFVAISLFAVKAGN